MKSRDFAELALFALSDGVSDSSLVLRKCTLLTFILAIGLDCVVEGKHSVLQCVYISVSCRLLAS